MGQIIVPPQIRETTGKIIFLAGPITGAPDWQTEAIRFIQRFSSEVMIANPKTKELTENAVHEEEEMDWEKYYLEKASKEGVILFWLAKEKKHMCDRPYAQTTRFELGEWKAKCQWEARKIVIGYEEGFNGIDYIKRRFQQDCPEIPFCKTLEKTCQEAVRMCGLSITESIFVD